MSEPEREPGEATLAKSPDASGELFPVAVDAGRRLGLVLAGGGLAVASAMLGAMGVLGSVAREPITIIPLVTGVLAAFLGARAAGGTAMRVVFALGRNPFVAGVGVALATVVSGLFGGAVGYVPYALLAHSGGSVFAGFGAAAFLLPFVLVIGSPAIVPLGLYFGHRARVARDAARDAGLLKGGDKALVKGANESA